LKGPSWSCSYGSWIYSYLCNKCPSPLTLWVWIPLSRCVVDTTSCDKVCQWLATGRWFSPGTPVSSTNKTDRIDITEICFVYNVKHHSHSHNRTRRVLSKEANGYIFSSHVLYLISRLKTTYDINYYLVFMFVLLVVVCCSCT
jgi:hypothetical protein